MTKPSDLASIWNKPDTSVLTPKQVSIRLPVIVAAKIDALLELYPNKNRTEIVGDLLLAALDEFEAGLKWEGIGEPEQLGPEYDFEVGYREYRGIGPRFRHAWQSHLKKYEEQLGHDVPIQLVRNKDEDREQ